MMRSIATKRSTFLGWLSSLLLAVTASGGILPLHVEGLAGPLSSIQVAGTTIAGSTLVLGDTAATPTPADPIPTLAYYYIWYTTGSWDRAKKDYPLLGRYSSNDVSVMRQQILWAKAAGIDGFIVSWKSTDVLNSRLEQLVEIAEQEDFKLAIIYQGLDFNRNPLPVSQVASDLDYFIQHFAGRKPFDLFAKPLVIWSGTWMFSADQVAQVTRSRRSSLLILASERNVAGLQRLAGLVDGDAYYWSSVNPDTFDGYQDKLTQMSAVIHQEDGLWIAPAAPGFDATQIGGVTIVDRKNGDTFRTQINTALASSPDALGIISWNEFSENSYIEPSQLYGFQDLDILSEINHMPPLDIGSFDSSDPAQTYPEVPPASKLIAIGGISVLILAGVIVIARRRS